MADDGLYPALNVNFKGHGPLFLNVPLVRDFHFPRADIADGKGLAVVG